MVVMIVLMMVMMHSGNLEGNRQQWNFFKSTNYDSFIQIYKILHLVKQHWSISGWFDHVWGTEIQVSSNTIFKKFANFKQFQGIDSCWHSRRPTYVVLEFLSSSDPYFMLVIKFVSVESKSTSEIAKIC